MITDSDYEHLAQGFLAATDSTLTHTRTSPQRCGEARDLSCDAYEVTLSRRRLKYTFYVAEAIGERADEPLDCRILLNLFKHVPGAFDEFCKESRLAPDSKEAQAEYIAARDNWESLRQLFPDFDPKLLRDLLVGSSTVPE